MTHITIDQRYCNAGPPFYDAGHHQTNKGMTYLIFWHAEVKPLLVEKVDAICLWMLVHFLANIVSSCPLHGRLLSFVCVKETSSHIEAFNNPPPAYSDHVKALE